MCYFCWSYRWGETEEEKQEVRPLAYTAEEGVLCHGHKRVACYCSNEARAVNVQTQCHGQHSYGLWLTSLSVFPWKVKSEKKRRGASPCLNGEPLCVPLPQLGSASSRMYQPADALSPCKDTDKERKHAIHVAIKKLIKLIFNRLEQAIELQTNSEISDAKSLLAI